MVPGLQAYYFNGPTAFPQMTTAIDWSNWGVTESYDSGKQDYNSYQHTDYSQNQDYSNYLNDFQAWSQRARSLNSELWFTA